MSKAQVTKAILTCSYNDSGPGLEQKIRDDYQREKAAGKTSLNHLILRNIHSGYDSLKFNLLLGGAPLFLYTLYTMHRSGIEQAAVVGNQETGKITKAFCEQLRIKGFEFVHEGKPEEWSLSNTLRRGKSRLKPSEGELILVCPGDTPFISMEGLVDNPYATGYDFIAPFNNKQNSGGFYPRNFHYVLVDEQGQEYPAKEATAMLINFPKLDKNRFGEELYDKAFGARKSYDQGNPQQKFIAELFLKENGKFSLQRAKKALSIVGIRQSVKEISRYLSKRVKGEGENEHNAPHMSIKSLEGLIEHAFGIPDFHVKIYPAPDPAAMLDIDSYEDLVFAESMLQQAENPSEIYPYYDELKTFCKGQGSFGCDFPERWHKYANAQFHKYSIKASYTSDGHLDQKVFPSSKIKGEIGLIKEFHGRKEE
ncbi:nucleotidyltransferase family protein [Candidatus Woesearchaeota archaeon]|nr:nucleotidyltransferase family protein [Candidatus Woesearchaeota archaeon]